MKNEQNRINMAYFNLVGAAIEKTLEPKGAIKRKENLHFAKHSKLLKLWCDCTDNFEYEKLKKIIIQKNEN